VETLRKADEEGDVKIMGGELRIKSSTPAPTSLTRLRKTNAL
jgi:hypothetical protein